MTSFQLSPLRACLSISDFSGVIADVMHVCFSDFTGVIADVISTATSGNCLASDGDLVVVPFTEANKDAVCEQFYVEAVGVATGARRPDVMKLLYH